MKNFLKISGCNLSSKNNAIRIQVYCETLKKLQKSIENKRRGMFTKSVFL